MGIELNGIALTIYSFLKSNCDEEGVYNGSLVKLAHSTLVSETATKRAVQALEKAEMLDVKRSKRGVSKITVIQ